ncbi:MAG: hypothetical protein H3C34_03615 [Caldilineaceae bacterium]|nr:hypothetical protein [Caldilineaceae bacterium]
MNNSILLSLVIACIPSRVKIPILRILGAKIGRGCYIGFSLINSKSIFIGNNVRIASFNLLHRLTYLYFGDGSRMNGFNWVTGAGIGEFFLGRNSAVTRLHFFESSGGIKIMENSIIAGRGTHFFTHGISATNLDDVRPIVIGPWCYVGSSSRFVPGSSIGKGSFVGMGSVITKNFTDVYVLIAGNPAVIRKKYSVNDIYFNRIFLSHDHQPNFYDGGRPD